MITRTKRQLRLILVALLLVLVSGLTFAQSDWGEVVKSSQHIPMESWGGFGYGDVAEGFVSFALDVDRAGPLTIEVLVTEIRQGASYEDDDSMLFLFNSDGNLIAENDDSEFGGYASLLNGVEIDSPGRYYAIVTTLPNRPDTDFNGFFRNIGEEGGSNFSFELIVEYGIREGGYGYDDDPYYGDAETVFWFDDLRALATPIHYIGGELVVGGQVGAGVAVYHLTLEEYPAPISAEVLVTGVVSQYGSGDTVLYMFDSEGNYIAENDDGGIEGGSLINEVYLDQMGGYYLAVVTFPNNPNMDDFGYLEGFPETGESDVEFDLIIGPPREYEYGNDYYGGSETVVWFDEFPDLATPLRYSGEEVVVRGSVGDGVALYHLTTDGPMALSVEVSGADDAGGDTVLFVIDSEGQVIAEDDDGGMNGGSLIYEVYLDQPGGYYVAVTSFPNWPNQDEYGYIEGFPLGGQGFVEFALTIGPPREYDYYGGDGGYGGEPYPDDGIGANAIEEVAHFSQPIPINNGRGIGAGEVGVGYSAFEIVIDEPLYITLEVVVTEVRQGVSYADSDTILTLFGEDGSWYASDDDGGLDGASKIDGVRLSQPGTYYAIVTTFPNEPETEFGFFTFIFAEGESNIAFDLVVRTDVAAQ